MEFVGEYHRDKVLSLPKNQRKQMDLPSWRDDEFNYEEIEISEESIGA